MTGARKPDPTGTPAEAAQVQAAWIAEGLVAPLVEALAPRVIEALRRQPPPERIAWTVEEIAGRIPLGTTKVAELVASGRLPSLKLDGRRMVREEALQALLKSLEDEHTAAIEAANARPYRIGRSA